MLIENQPLLNHETNWHARVFVAREVPTVASTDAPTSALAVVYTEDGAFEEYRFFPRNPDLVLVDSQIIANAPAAFLAAGVGDALATRLEARATAASNSLTMAGGLPTLTRRATAGMWMSIPTDLAALAGPVRSTHRPGSTWLRTGS